MRVLRIGDTHVLASDGQAPGPASFQGFALSLTVPNEAEAERPSRPSATAVRCNMPLAKTFFSRASAWSPTASESRGWFT